MLFDPLDIEDPKPAPKSKKEGAAVEAGKGKEPEFWANKTIGFKSAAQALDGFGRGSTVHTISHGTWNQFDLIDYLQTITGPAEFTMATWSVSDAGVRRVVEMRLDGRFTAMACLINRQMLNWQGAAAAMLCNGSDEHGIGYCHAKTYVLTNDDWAISVVTSANLTGNPGLEAGVITEDRTVANWHKAWIKSVIEKQPNLTEQIPLTGALEDVEQDKKPDGRLYLIRGLPGAGKTTIGDLLAPDASFSTLDHFYQSGEYIYRSSDIGQAAEACESKAGAAMRAGVTPIAVANHFSTQAEADPFIELARDHGYSVSVIECQTPHRDIHEIGPAIARKMEKRWKKITT